MVTITLYARQKKRHRCIEQTFGLCGRRRGWDDLREHHWNMYIIKCETDHQSRLDAWDKCSGMGWGGRWERGSGWGTHVNPWLIHVNVWQQPLQYCKVISLQLIKINGKKEKEWICNTLSTQADFISYSTSLKNHGVSSWNKTDKRETMHIYLLKRGKDNDVGEMGKWQVHVFISASKKIEHTL